MNMNNEYNGIEYINMNMIMNQSEKDNYNTNIVINNIIINL